MRDLENPVIAGAVICFAILLQVFVPALFDIIISLAVAAGGFMLGRAFGRSGTKGDRGL
jgi:hypothetical protein